MELVPASCLNKLCIFGLNFFSLFTVEWFQLAFFFYLAGLTVVGGTLTVNSATQLAAFKADHNIAFDVMFTSSNTSGGVSGTGLWDLVVFPAKNANGSGLTGPETSVDLDTCKFLLCWIRHSWIHHSWIRCLLS